MKKLIFIISIFLGTPFISLALVSGNGYQLYEQVTTLTNKSSGNGFNLYQSGNTIQGYTTGAGFTVLNGGSPAVVSTVTPSPAPAPAPAPGGGGGGGGSIVFQPVSTTTKINNTYLNQTGDQNQKSDYSNDFRADINDSGKVDIFDFNTLMTNWSKRQAVDMTLSKKDRCPLALFSDVNCDSKVDILDFNLIIVYWGTYVGNEGVLLKNKGKANPNEQI